MENLGLYPHMASNLQNFAQRYQKTMATASSFKDGSILWDSSLFSLRV